MSTVNTNSYVGTNTDNAQLNNLSKFNTYFSNRYFDPFVRGYAFVFVTRPSLFIYPTTSTDDYNLLAYKNVCKDPYFSQFITGETMNEQDRVIFEQLSFRTDFSGSSYYSATHFLPLFTNMVKNFDVSDTTMDVQNVFETKQGFSMPMPTFKTASEAAGQITLTMDESSNLDVTKMMGIWVNYIANISDGTFSANPQCIRSRVIDYMSSLYYFVLAPDGKTLRYWAKYTGIWPTNIPYSALGYTRGSAEISEVSVNFNYTTKEDMNIEILEDFNRVALGIEDEAYTTSNASEYLTASKSAYLGYNEMIEKYQSTYNGNGVNPLVVLKDNSSVSNENATGTLTNRYTLLFPIDINNLYTTTEFNNDFYYYNEDVFEGYKLNDTEIE